MQNNTNTVKATVIPFVRDLVSLCAIHPADFVREIGKVESLKDSPPVIDFRFFQPFSCLRSFHILATFPVDKCCKHTDNTDRSDKEKL